MKQRYKMLAATIAAIFVAVGVRFFSSDDNGPAMVNQTRRILREQGFKTDLADFNFFTSPEARAREAFLTNYSGPIPSNGDSAAWHRRNQLQMRMPNLMEVLGRDSAEVVARRDISFDTGEDFWRELRKQFDIDAKQLDGACEVLIGGPVRFHLDAKRGNGMLLPHLGGLRRLEQTLGTGVVLNLHDGERGAAWKNLLAATRLITAWEPEPTEVSTIVRYLCAQTAFNILWQALQVGGWSEEQLNTLAREWAGADFFKAIPEKAAFERACWVAETQSQRARPLAISRMTPGQMIRSPQLGFYDLQGRVRERAYRQFGSFEDEHDLLVHYRDREMELRHAIVATTWQDMRSLPGVTHALQFVSSRFSPVQMLMNMQRSTHAAMSRGIPMCGKAAETEARRRLILTAIALELYKVKKGVYPKDLDDLGRERIPSARANAMVDFMDGKTLRYRTTDAGRFVLYSVGLDCIDDGGVADADSPDRASHALRMGIQTGKDIVWPRPATDEEVRAEERRRKQAELRRLTN